MAKKRLADDADFVHKALWPGRRALFFLAPL